MGLNFLDYDVSRTVANVVVDGSANEATVFTLSHWPGALAPAGLARDLSAEMAYAYLDTPFDHEPVEVVTNNHFDQDGLVAAHALTHPDVAQDHREILIDVAAAGDFATYHDRRAARASMVIAHWNNIGWSYRQTLPLLVDLAINPEPYHDIWHAEDTQLAASEAALDRGAVRIREIPELDLAIVEIDDDEPQRSGHRFAHETFVGIHPMALHNATQRFRLLVLSSARFQFIDRYETWVQYQSRPTLPRIEMATVATALTQLDSVEWRAGNPAELVPMVSHDGSSHLDRDTVTDLIVTHLTTHAN